VRVPYRNACRRCRGLGVGNSWWSWLSSSLGWAEKDRRLTSLEAALDLSMLVAEERVADAVRLEAKHARAVA
jgi:hypothetical protein